jgi:hypothetical protein
VAILKNTLDALEAAGAKLRRVVNYQGGKAYGALYGNVRAPARESDPRVPGPLFYYDQETCSTSAAPGQGFATTILRPDYVQGIGLGSYVTSSTRLQPMARFAESSASHSSFPAAKPPSMRYFR